MNRYLTAYIRHSLQKSASSYLDRYYQSVNQPSPAPEKSPPKSIKSANNQVKNIFKWKNPQMKQYFTNDPGKSQRRRSQPPEKLIDQRLEETDIR